MMRRSAYGAVPPGSASATDIVTDSHDCDFSGQLTLPGRSAVEPFEGCGSLAPCSAPAVARD
jgi:hypothetical protein